MKVCPYCKTLNEDKNIFCIGCSKKIEAVVLFCSQCGNKILSSNKFCLYCGNGVGKSTEVISSGAKAVSTGNIPEKNSPETSQTSEIHKVPVVTQTSEINKAPEITQTSSNNQIPPREKKPYKNLVIVLSIFLPVFFISLAAALILSISQLSIFKPIAKPYENRFTADYSFSQDQKTAINRWGHPDGFLLAIDPETSERFESWFYYVMGAEMIFVNGKFMEGSDLIVYDVTGAKDGLTVYPYEFTNKASRDDIIAVLGAPTTEDSYQDGELTVMYYKKDLVITLLDNKVAGITFFHTEPDAIK